MRKQKVEKKHETSKLRQFEISGALKVATLCPLELNKSFAFCRVFNSKMKNTQPPRITERQTDTT